MGIHHIILMSLLFLTDVLSGFQARDDAGRPIPSAVLTFWRSGTTAPLAVYSDQDLATQLSDSRGRVVGNASGVFPFIYMQPDELYRVKLETADGVLRWDLDPYLCDCADPPFLFRGPFFQALSTDDRTSPGATITLSITETETPTNAYADSDLSVPLPNPLPANAGAFFPPVYLDDAIDYRVRVKTAAGATLLELDPYECACGFRSLTSWPYSLEDVAELDLAATMERGTFPPVLADDADISATLIAGVLDDILLAYGEWPLEEIDVSAELTAGVLDEILLDYGEWPVEEIDVDATMRSGVLKTVLITYDEWPVESVDVSSSLISGSLT